MKGALASQEAQIVSDLSVGDLSSGDGIDRTLQSLAEVTAKQPRANMRRIAEIRQICKIASDKWSAGEQTKAIREQNRTLMRLEHGEHAFILLEQLKANRTLRPLPPGPGQAIPRKEA